jgi:hypothetical protein
VVFGWDPDGKEGDTQAMPSQQQACGGSSSAEQLAVCAAHTGSDWHTHVHLLAMKLVSLSAGM